MIEMRDMNKFVTRLNWERAGLMSLNCEWIQVSPIVGAGPVSLEFHVDVLGKTYLKHSGDVLTEGTHSFVMSVSSSYPFVAPVVSFSGPNPPAHLNFFSNGNVCIGGWNRAEENLATLAIRITRCIFLAPETFNFKSPADSQSMALCRLIANGSLEQPQLPGPIPVPDFGGAA
ncbi:MAG: hypothetical protein GX418_00290 [Clostridiales bacterium]|nr:hypothetical protein [Clostridiales bacterium]